MRPAAGRESLEQPWADLHVHTQWSWDAPRGAMEESCRQALEVGLKTVAFTDHADHSEISGGNRLDAAGYWASLERCRMLFPELVLLSGVELGEPHRFVVQAQDLLQRGPFDLTLGSVHGIPDGSSWVDFSELRVFSELTPGEVMGRYFAEVLQLLRGPVGFQVLAHLEYPKRYWPASWGRYRSADFREQIEAVLVTLAGAGVVLELNSTRGGDPARCLCPSPEVVRWWRELGGDAVSLGSDAHDPASVGLGLALAREVAEAAGFRPAAVPPGIWRASLSSGSGPPPMPRGARTT